MISVLIVIDIIENSCHSTINICDQLLAKSCRDNSLRGDFGLFDQLRSPADPTLSDLIVKDRNTSSYFAITPSIHGTDITSLSFRAMARTKQTMRKTRNVKRSTGVKSTKEFTCFVCSFKCTIKNNYCRHLARMHSKKDDGTQYTRPIGNSGVGFYCNCFSLDTLFITVCACSTRLD